MGIKIIPYLALYLILIIKFGAFDNNEISCCMEELNNYDLTGVSLITEAHLILRKDQKFLCYMVTPKATMCITLIKLYL